MEQTREELDWSYSDGFQGRGDCRFDTFCRSELPRHAATRITAVSLLSGGMLSAIRQNERRSGDRPRDARQQSIATHRG